MRKTTRSLLGVWLWHTVLIGAALLAFGIWQGFGTRQMTVALVIAGALELASIRWCVRTWWFMAEYKLFWWRT